MRDDEVVCASCGARAAKDSADIVDYGTGYRCEACSVKRDVDEHVRAAAVNERAQRRSRDGIGYYAFGPSAAEVKAEVDAIRAHPPTPDARVPSAAEIEPVIQADDITLMATTVGSQPAAAEVRASASAHPRYLCIVCYRVVANWEAECPRDGVPLSDLTNDEAVGELREHVRRAANRREGKRVAITMGFSIVTSLWLCLMMNWSFGWGGTGGFLMMAIMVISYSLSLWAVPGLRVRNRVDDLLAAVAKIDGRPVSLADRATPADGPYRSA